MHATSLSPSIILLQSHLHYINMKNYYLLVVVLLYYFLLLLLLFVIIIIYFFYAHATPREKIIKV